MSKLCLYCSSDTGEPSLWKRFGYCSSEHFVTDSRWLLDDQARVSMNCFCASPSAHELVCPWLNASKRLEILKNLGVQKEATIEVEKVEPLLPFEGAW